MGHDPGGKINVHICMHMYIYTSNNINVASVITDQHLYWYITL